MQTNEKCSVYLKRPDEFSFGRSFLGGAQRVDRESRSRCGFCARSICRPAR